MRIGIMSDTHGSLKAMRQAVIAVPPVDMWLHAGDFSQDSSFLAQITGIPVTAVKGNCDGMTTAKPDEFLSVGDKQLWLTHGHQYGAQERINELVLWSHKYNVDIVVYGHTHVPLIEWHEDILVINPGSAARPRGHGATCAVLEISKNSIAKAQIIYING